MELSLVELMINLITSPRGDPIAMTNPMADPMNEPMINPMTIYLM